MQGTWLIGGWTLTVILSVTVGAAIPEAAGDERQSCYPLSAASSGERWSHSCPQTAQDSEGTPEQQDRKKYIQGVLSRSKVHDKRLASTGSGFFVDLEGNLLTNFRLIDGCASVSISPVVGEMALGQVIAYDTKLDLALVRAELRPSDIASLIGSEGALTREPVYVAGYPQPGPLTTTPVLTPVDVLGAQHTVLGRPTILVKGDVRSGNNGGPLLDSGGGVIGTLVAGKTQTSSASGPDDSLVGQALPTEAIREFLDAQGIDYHLGLELPPKPPDRLIADARRFMAQVGCWQ